MEKNILVVGQDKTTSESLAENLKKTYSQEYQILKTNSIQQAKQEIKNIDEKGDKLALTCVDLSSYSNEGGQFLNRLSDTHPKTSKMMYVGKDADIDVLTEEQALTPLKGLEKEKDLNEMVDELLQTYERLPNFECNINGISIKLADTLHEKEEFFRLRNKIYLASKHINQDKLSPLQHELGMEWDEFDYGGIDKILLDSPTQYVVVKDKDKVVGGARIIKEKCPLENGICVSTGEEFGLDRKYNIGDPFTLDTMREKGMNITEISRLIVDKDYRGGDSAALIGILRLVNHLTQDENYFLCTSKEKQIPLYQAIGFQIFGPKINYSLSGTWVPMLGDKYAAANNPETIPGISKEFHQIVTEPIPECHQYEMGEISKVVNQKAIRMGLYQNGKN